MDPVISRQMYRTLEPYHAMIYFVPEARSAYERLGLDSRPMGYFASRGAPLGAVSAEVISAIFYNFHPALVASVIPEAWQRAAPAQISAARLEAIDAALRRLLGASLDAPEAQQAADLALWHAATLLREFRFGGHCAALMAEGIDACEALVTHAATGEISARALQASRAWPNAEWAAACKRLQARGWLAPDNTLTDEGKARRAAVEQRTDQLALPPWEQLGEANCKRLRELARPFSKAITEAGTFPASLAPWED